MVDLSSVGAAHRTEAEKLGHRAIFFAAVSVLGREPINGIPPGVVF